MRKYTRTGGGTHTSREIVAEWGSLYGCSYIQVIYTVWVADCDTRRAEWYGYGEKEVRQAGHLSLRAVFLRASLQHKQDIGSGRVRGGGSEKQSKQGGVRCRRVPRTDGVKTHRWKGDLD